MSAHHQKNRRPQTWISALPVNVAALVVILCGAAHFLPALPVAPAGIASTDGSSVWKTYRSNRFGFQFRYPPASSVSAGGPYASQSGTQPDSLETLQIRGKGNRLEMDISVFGPGIVHGEYDWPERPCGEWTFGPDHGPLSSDRIRFAGQKTLHVIAQNFGGGDSPQINNYYCVNHPQNPIVIVVFGHPPSAEAQQILASFHFFKVSR